MKLQSLTAKNFLSIGAIELDFPANGMVLLSGWNDDTGRANGAGKSSVFQAVCWCLYGKFPRDVKVDEIVRRGQKSCEASVTFADKAGRTVRVVRSRPTKLQLFVDDVLQDVASKDVQSRIEALIGLTYEQYLITSYFPQNGVSSRFLKQTDSVAKDFLANILSLDKIDASHERAKAKVKELEASIKACETQEQTLSSTIDALRRSMASPLPEGPDRSRVKELKSRLEEINALLVVPVDSSEVDALISKNNEKQQAIAKARSQQGVLEAAIASLKRSSAQRVNHQECPHCDGALVIQSGKIVEFDEAAHERHLQEEQEARDAELAQKEPYLAKVKDAIAKEPTVLAEYRELLSRKNNLGSSLAPLREEKASISAELKGMIALGVAREQAEKSRKEVETQLERLSEDFSKVADKRSSAAEELMLWAAVKAVFAPTGFVAYSLDGVIEDINAAASSYLDVLSQGTMTYELQSTTADGKPKMVHSVCIDGEPVSVGSLSGGEERCVIFAVDMAIGDVLAKRANAELPSVLLMDECLDGLDSVGKEKVLDALKELSADRCIMVVDHSTEFSALFDQTLRVVKKDKVSSLEVT